MTQPRLAGGQGSCCSTARRAPGTAALALRPGRRRCPYQARHPTGHPYGPATRARARLDHLRDTGLGRQSHRRHGEILLRWEEHQGWNDALLGLSPHDVIFYSVPPCCAPGSARRRRWPWPTRLRNWCVTGGRPSGTLDELDGAQEIWAAAAGFRRSRLGLAPVGLRDGGAGTTAAGATWC